jgi:hypothetical protein
VRTIPEALLIVLLALITWSVATRFLTRSSVLHPFSRPLMPAQIVVSPMRTTYWTFEVSGASTNARYWNLSCAGRPG